MHAAVRVAQDRRHTSRPMKPIAASLVEYSDTDAAGEPRLVGDGPVVGPALRVLAVFDTTPSLRYAVWKKDPHCLECGKLVASPEDAGYVPTPDGFRVAHRMQCLAAATFALNPTFADAVERDAAAATVDLRLVPDYEDL